MSYKKNVAGQFFCFQGVDASTGGIKSGVSWTVRRCIDGTFAASSGSVTEDGTTGWYKFALSQADTNGNDIGFNFTGTGAVPQTVNIITDGAPSDVNLTKIDGQATNGNNATLNLKQLNIVNNAGNALVAQSTGGNGNGAYFFGNGTGYGIDILAGNNGIGLEIDGGSGASGGAAVNIASGTIGSAVVIEGAVAGVEIYGDGGDGLIVSSAGGNGHGINVSGNGTGKSVNAPNDIAVSDGTLNLAGVNAQVVDVLRTDTVPDSVATDGSQPTLTQAVYEILQFLTEKSVVSTTLTVNKVDGSTALMTFTLDSATDPTSITRAT